MPAGDEQPVWHARSLPELVDGDGDHRRAIEISTFAEKTDGLGGTSPPGAHLEDAVVDLAEKSRVAGPCGQGTLSITKQTGLSNLVLAF